LLNIASPLLGYPVCDEAAECMSCKQSKLWSNSLTQGGMTATAHMVRYNPSSTVNNYSRAKS
jgi:hypothetical protein